MSAYAENRKKILVSLPNPEIDNLLQQQSIRQISKEKVKNHNLNTNVDEKS